MKNILPTLCLFALLFGSVRPALADPLQLPEMGDSSTSVFSPAEAERIGREAFQSIKRSGRLIEDPELEQYISDLGYRLLSSSPEGGQNFTFFLIEDPTINAFAMPGGYIGFHSGLILASSSEDEVAAVMAHEISHVTQHHLARSLEKARDMNLPMTAALIAALILGGQDAQMTSAALATTLATQSQLQLNYSRSHEHEADRLGMQMLSDAGYDPNGMPQFFERLQQQSRYYTALPEFLSTHPVTSDRIADSRNRAAQLPHTARLQPQTTYQLAKAKLRVLSSKDLDQLIAQLQESLAKGRYENEAAERYAYALALSHDGQHDEARAQFRQLLKRSPERISFLLAHARNEAAMEEYGSAAEVYAQGLRLYPANLPLCLGYADVLLKQQKPDEARRLLSDLLKRHPNQARTYQLLGQAEEQSGNLGAAYLAQAEYYALEGEPHTAITQLKQAQRLPKLDFYLASRIEAKLQQLQDEIKQQRKRME